MSTPNKPITTATIDRWVEQSKRAEVLRRTAKVVTPENSPELAALLKSVAESTAESLLLGDGEAEDGELLA